MKILSLNVEKREHIEGVARLIEQERPDVVCLMEMCILDFEKVLSDYPYRVSGPNFALVGGGEVGVVVAAKTEIEGSVWYADGRESRAVPVEALGVHRPVIVEVIVGGFALGAVHFTWTPQMSESTKQTADLSRLLAHLGEREIVIFGDFNIPRGNKTYQILAKKYLDNIPAEVKTTIDWELHYAKRAGRKRFEAVVDYVFSTPRYRVGSVRLVTGVSDHYGTITELGKA